MTRRTTRHVTRSVTRSVTRRTARRTAIVAAVLPVLVLLAGCGGDDEPGSTDVEVVEVNVEAGEVTPDGDRVEVDVDQPVDIVVTSDEAGELHVHSSPEQTFTFEAGENEPIELQFDRPGRIEVELHEPTEAPVVEFLIS